MFTLKRLAELIPVLLIVSFCAFSLVRVAPGGPFDSERELSSEAREEIEKKYHLDKPLFSQYFYFLKNIMKGDLGLSMKYQNHNVTDIIKQGLPVSMILGFTSFIVSLALGIFIGVIAAWRKNYISGKILTILGLLFVCVPSMVLGPLLILVFAIYFPIFPTSFLTTPWHAVLPVTTLSLYYAGKISRLVSEGLIEALESDYIRTARSKGVSSLSLLFKHALPMGLLPVISYSGPLLADLLTGSFVVENLFQIPGLGTFLVNSSLNRDHTMVVGLVLVYSILIIVFNIVVDLFYAKVDPRIKTQES